MARKLESFRRELAGGEDARKEMAKRALVLGYEAAAAQAAGQPVDPDTSMENPRHTMQVIVNALANMESDVTAARMLGLSEAHVAATRASLRKFQAGVIRRLVDSKRKERRWRRKKAI